VEFVEVYFLPGATVQVVPVYLSRQEVHFVSLPVTGSQIGPLHFGPPVHFFSHFVPQEPLLQLLQAVKLPESLLHVPLAQFVGSLQAFSHEFPQKPSAQEVQL
jgi:hypothetical protein